MTSYLSESILAVGSGVDEKSETPGNQAEIFHPNDNVWKDAGQFRDIYAIFFSPMIYFDGMFIMFGGMITTLDERVISTKTIMKLDENTIECPKLNSVGHCWTNIGELRQERSMICNLKYSGYSI